MVTKLIISFLQIIFLYHVFEFYKPMTSKFIKLRRAPLGFCFAWNVPFPILLFIPKAAKTLTVVYIDFLTPIFDINVLVTSTTVKVFKSVGNRHMSVRLRGF
jgi:hypothetical protein